MTAHAAIDADPIGVLMPWANGEERWLRNRMLQAQQLSATRALQATSDQARQLFWMINETASIAATTPASLANLKELRDGLLRLFLVADMFERREGADG